MHDVANSCRTVGPHALLVIYVFIAVGGFGSQVLPMGQMMSGLWRDKIKNDDRDLSSSVCLTLRPVICENMDVGQDIFRADRRSVIWSSQK